MTQVEQNITDLINNLDVVMSELTLQIGLDAKALIQRRVQEQGQTAEGESTGLYSLQYKKKREKKGRNVAFVDLTDTGDMWQSTGFVEKRQDKRETVISIGGRDTLSQNKINWNSEKKFEVLKLSKSEEEILNQVFAENFAETVIGYLEK